MQRNSLLQRDWFRNVRGVFYGRNRGEMTEREKAEAGLLYDANSDPQIVRDRLISQELSYDYNML